MIKPIYLVWDDEAKRYIHNTTRDIGIYSSKAEEFFSRADLEAAYYIGLADGTSNKCDGLKIGDSVEQLIEHDGKPYMENHNE